jgi:hypothetical protein
MLGKLQGLVRPEELGKLEKKEGKKKKTGENKMRSPHRVLNPRPSCLQHSGLSVVGGHDKILIKVKYISTKFNAVKFRSTGILISADLTYACVVIPSLYIVF